MKEIEQMHNDYDFWMDPIERDHIRSEFQKVFEQYIDQNYPAEKDTLMCSIHESFHGEGHNCVACNLEEGSKLIANFLKNYNTFETPDSVFTPYIWYLYLMVTRMEEYIAIMNLNEGIRQKKFGIFQRIKQWANFVKHPKAFMFVHHPCYFFAGSTELEELDLASYEIVIDDKFVKEFYSGGDNNGKLYSKLSKKENVLVVFPNPINLMTEFLKAQKNFVDLICNNEMIRELLDDKATKYYEQKDTKNKEENNGN